MGRGRELVVRRWDPGLVMSEQTGGLVTSKGVVRRFRPFVGSRLRAASLARALGAPHPYVRFLPCELPRWEILPLQERSTTAARCLRSAAGERLSAYSE